MTNKNDSHGSQASKDSKGHHHYILPDKLAIIVVSILLFLTVITVWTAGIDFGALNFPLAMAIATTKALLVSLIFMNLKNDSRENSVIFFTSFLFLAIFIILTGSDIFFRGDVYVKGPLAAASGGKAKFKKPWNATPEILAHGKELFSQQCTSCHGNEGLGNGPAAAGLVPPPRNFHGLAGWKNGRKPSQIFGTLTKGLAPAMPAFSTLSAEDRWALAGYVSGLNPEPQKDSTQDLVAVGVDPSKDTMGGEAQSKTIPVRIAMDRMTQPEPQVVLSQVHSAGMDAETHPMAAYYANHCASCHGARAEGAVVTQMGASPKAFIRVGSIAGVSFEQFRSIVIRGIPGDLMPGYGNLSNTQIQELYNHVKSLGGHAAGASASR